MSNYESKLMAQLKQILEATDIPTVPEMKELVDLAEVVTKEKIQKQQAVIYL